MLIHDTSKVAAADARVKIAEEQASVSHDTMLQTVKRAEAAADAVDSKAAAMVLNVAEESSSLEATESDAEQGEIAAGEELVTEAENSLAEASAEVHRMEKAAAEQATAIVDDATNQGEQLKTSTSSAQVIGPYPFPYASPTP